MLAAAWLFLRGVSWQIYAAILLMAVLTFSHVWAYRKGEASTQEAWDAQKVKDEAAQQAADARQAKLDQAAAQRYEQAKAAQRVRVVTVTKEITHAIETAPAWSAEPVPAGVRDAIAAAGQAFAASQPDGAVRLPAAGGPEQRATGPGLRLGPFKPGGLFGAASSPG